MNEKVYKVLEFDKVKEILKTYAQSPMAADVISDLVPLTKAHEIRERLMETDEAAGVLLAKGSLPLGGLYDIKKKVRSAEKGRLLGMGDLLEVASSLRVASEVRNFLSDGSLPDIPRLREYAGFLTEEQRLTRRIADCILGPDEMADSASPQLMSIRRRMRRQSAAARDRINSMISSHAFKDMLQDAVITMRDGRPVIPVKQEYRGSIPGIVHDSSASGSTLFIEPQAVVDINNELRELDAAERDEIERIMKSLSSDVGSAARDIVRNQKYLTRLDFIFAKGRMSVDYRCTAAEINNSGLIDIRQGRHPLIDQDKVVPIDITAGGSYKTLIITGPNTGGKTVALKTAGLLMLMNQAGMHIPAGPGTTLPVMKKIYADIGDEQSIEQSLSTFSSHMKNIVEITSDADEHSFILIDELGAGTDPAEGAALAVAILEYLASKGSVIFATTHYSELKRYAMETDGVENASMEFDVEKLAPTYRMIIGVPGRSNAFEIARRLGLDDGIIDDASHRLTEEHARFEELAGSIEKDKKDAEKELRQARKIYIEINKRQKELDRRAEADEAKRARILEKARQQASDTVADARRFSDEMKKELRQLRKEQAAGSNAREIEIRHKIRDREDKYRRKAQPAHVRNDHPAKLSDIKRGARVRVVSLDKKGVIAGEPDDKGEVMVQIGLIKTRVPLADITIIDEHGVQKNFERSRYGRMYKNKAMNISPEINVIGKTLDEACDEVDKYLDDAYMSGLKKVRVIHGRGTGTLRKGLREMFRRNRHVDSFESAPYNEGGEGATIVNLGDR